MLARVWVRKLRWKVPMRPCLPLSEDPSMAVRWKEAFLSYLIDQEAEGLALKDFKDGTLSEV